jgi:hypothetical protein
LPPACSSTSVAHDLLAGGAAVADHHHGATAACMRLLMARRYVGADVGDALEGKS